MAAPNGLPLKAGVERRLAQAAQGGGGVARRSCEHRLDRQVTLDAGSSDTRCCTGSVGQGKCSLVVHTGVCNSGAPAHAQQLPYMMCVAAVSVMPAPPALRQHGGARGTWVEQAADCGRLCHAVICSAPLQTVGRSAQNTQQLQLCSALLQRYSTLQAHLWVMRKTLVGGSIWKSRIALLREAARRGQGRQEGTSIIPKPHQAALHGRSLRPRCVGISTRADKQPGNPYLPTHLRWMSR